MKKTYNQHDRGFFLNSIGNIRYSKKRQEIAKVATLGDIAIFLNHQVTLGTPIKDPSNFLAFHFYVLTSDSQSYRKAVGTVLSVG